MSIIEQILKNQPQPQRPQRLNGTSVSHHLPAYCDSTVAARHRYFRCAPIFVKAVLDQRTPDQKDYLETLVALVGQYDDEHYTEDLTHLSPLDSLKYLMERHEMNGSQLGDLLGGNRSLGGKVLRGERQLSKAHIRILAERFKVNPSLFL